ncbi:RidA family protein [Hansschlegelia plantiphila]|uniref:RidA family protein n=1 Tax=Hansschlegelia plantiphila TaxID=374655 RepID=A0A9W6J510_9HYPH|nr:RidA family protein [Hansschlegelia plantiphila]GLK69873.1 hypothetical protein GCM10008179_35110 [Hansschlegelia plantiphila]
MSSASEITRYDSNGRLSKVVVHNGVVYLSGLTAKVKTPDAKAQTADILAQIDGYLKQGGSDKSRLLRVNIWLHDMAHFDAMNEVWDGWVDKDAAPSRATVMSPLAGDGINLVEMMATAVV